MSFASFTCRRLAKCSETLPNIIIGSNGLEWMLHNFGTSKYCIPARNMSFSCFTCGGFVKCSVTLPNIILGAMDKNGSITTLVPRNSAFGLEHKFCFFYVSKVSEMPRNTPKHHFGSNGLEWMLYNFGTLK
jgi:hypothetical protein